MPSSAIPPTYHSPSVASTANKSWTSAKRSPGAIDAGPNVNTWISIVCFFGICDDWGGDDIPQDFPIPVTVTVPAGAKHLIVAPIDFWRHYRDNTGMGFGVEIAVNP